jgi:hypothetical protein
MPSMEEASTAEAFMGAGSMEEDFTAEEDTAEEDTAAATDRSRD